MEKYEAKWGCDFIGNDFWKTNTFSPDKCSKTCLANRECTHFTYTSDGVCWMKTGQVSAEQAISSKSKQTICGVVFRDEKTKIHAHLWVYLFLDYIKIVPTGLSRIFCRYFN